VTAVSDVRAVLPAQLHRTVFATARAAEFLERRALQAQTGQPADRFGDVIVKELMDNALDAAETAGVDPRIGRPLTPGEALAKLFLANADRGANAANDELIEALLERARAIQAIADRRC
jgi:DNA topoisomerase VI subunit B